jgi:hypothetical protein
VGRASDALVDSQYSIKVLAMAGTWVALRFTSTIDDCYGEEVEKAFDARTGRSYRFYESGLSGDQEICGEGNPNPYSVGRVLLNSFGQLAIALETLTTRHIVGVEPNGAKRRLDSAPAAQIPLASLTLEGHEVRWLDAEGARTASL